MAPSSKSLHDPVLEYQNVYRGRFLKVAGETFAQLASEACVDREANKQTCQKLDLCSASLEETKGRVNSWTFFCVLLWLLVAAGIILAFIPDLGLPERGVALLILGELAVLVLLSSLVHPRIRKHKAAQKELQTEVNQLTTLAWQQMEPLNNLYRWDMLSGMITRTVPDLVFDPYFTTERLEDLVKEYGWDNSFNDKRSVLYSHSGHINGNPFVICRTRTMRMGEKTYEGSKTIYWTTLERGSDGRYHTVHHSQTLHAYVTAPYPEYPEETRLIYANLAAPDLIFNRQQSGLAIREDSLAFRRKRRALRRKARDLENKDFALLTNEEFEVAFNTSDRNHNQQFALLFTPLAQENMLKLLKDYKVGYGDDFDFLKDKMINTIIPQHLQELNLDLNPVQYRSYHFEQAREAFLRVNANYFRAIYFSFAPLLCVPLYRQMRSIKDIYGPDVTPRSAFWEHEAQANLWGSKHFEHPQCATPCLLKTEVAPDSGTGTGTTTAVTVYAHGYRKEKRLTHVSKFGADGHIHSVPVYWDEYLPVTGKGSLRLQEDPGTPAGPGVPDTPFLNEQQRIRDLLAHSGLSAYRRHIASLVGS